MNQEHSGSMRLDDYDEEARHPERYPNPVLKALGKCIKWFFLLLAAAVFALMLWRINAMESLPRDMRGLAVTEQTAQAYVAAQQRGETLELWTQSKLDPVSTNEEAYGYFWIAQSILVPEAQQLQLVVRYNNSTLEHLASDYRLGEIPSRDDEVLSLRLRVVTDATPDDPRDNDETAAQTVSYLMPTGVPEAATRDVYNFRRFVFDDVPTGEDVIALVVEFYYAGDADAEVPLTELYAYYERAATERVDMTRKDVKKMEEYVNP